MIVYQYKKLCYTTPILHNEELYLHNPQSFGLIRLGKSVWDAYMNIAWNGKAFNIFSVPGLLVRSWIRQKVILTLGTVDQEPEMDNNDDNDIAVNILYICIKLKYKILGLDIS